LLILAVETSCDDSAAALLEGTRTVAEVIRSQQEHGETGGVVPEIASRLHMEVLPDLVGSILREAGAKTGDVDLFAATAGPGLIGSLLVGLSWAKAAALACGRPFLGINHLAAHIFSHYGDEPEVEFPAVALLVSGGHTCLFRMEKGWHDCVLLGGTRDDAAGEAFDKTARMLGLGYPGGPGIDRLASIGDPDSVVLPSPLEDPGNPEFSFSGLKTAVRLQWEKGARVEDIAASFNRTVVRILVSKFFAQLHLAGARSALVGGGVAANSLLRKTLAEGCGRTGTRLLLPRCPTDNATMVGRAAAAVIDRDPDACSGMSCNAFARWTGERLEALVP